MTCRTPTVRTYERSGVAVSGVACIFVLLAAVGTARAGPAVLRDASSTVSGSPHITSVGDSVLLLVSGATRDVQWLDPTRVGVLFSPANRNSARLTAGRVWGIDNGAFAGFDANAFVDLIGRLRRVPGCRFVVAPDVVGDSRATAELFDLWEPMIRALGYPVALAAQDGLTVPGVPWDRIDALFIGGSTEWKLSREVDNLLAFAGARGKWRHVGRVNTRRRMRHFWNLTDSIDGSGFSRWPKRGRQATRWLAELEAAPRLREAHP